MLDAETSEPEEDYGKLVIEKLKKKEEAEGELREPDFARESKVTAAQKNPFLPPDDSVEKRHGKGKIQVVDRRDFQDIVEKSAKQSAAQAFRQKFASNKKGISRKQNDDSKQEEAVDIDSFLEDILAPKPKGKIPSILDLWPLKFETGFIRARNGRIDKVDRIPFRILQNEEPLTATCCVTNTPNIPSLNYPLSEHFDNLEVGLTLIVTKPKQFLRRQSHDRLPNR